MGTPRAEHHIHDGGTRLVVNRTMGPPSLEAVPEALSVCPSFLTRPQEGGRKGDVKMMTATNKHLLFLS